MNRTISFLLVAVIALSIVGCGSTTTPTPAPTQPQQVITVVITATLPPPTATSPAPTVTPMPTLPLTTTVVAATPTTQAVVKPTTVARAATRTPTKRAVAPTAAALPMRFGAPSLLNPIWTDDRKDEAKFPGGAIIFDWLSVGGLGGDECYLVQVATEPVNPGAGIGAASDYLLTNCGDQTQTGLIVKATNSQHSFTLESPNRVGTAPNYGSILLNTDQMWANWSLTVVKNLGQCDAAYQYHCKWAAISPPGKARFLFKGG